MEMITGVFSFVLGTTLFEFIANTVFIPNSKQFIAMVPLEALERARMTSVGHFDLLVTPYYLYTFNKHLRSPTFLNGTWSGCLAAWVSRVIRE